MVTRRRTWPMAVFGRRDQRGRIRPMSGQTGVYGSGRPGAFIRDAISGVDSVDIVTIGDSNSVYAQGDPDAGGPYGAATMGWTSGWARALHSLGAQMYATPLFPCCASAGTATPGTNLVAGTFVQYPTYSSSPLQNVGEAASTDIAYALSTAAGAEATTLRALALPDSTLRPFGLVGWDAVYLPAGALAFRDFTQYVGHNGSGGLVASGSNKTFIQAGGSYAHRVFHATIPPDAPLGSFVMRVRNTTTSGDLLTSAAIPTDAAGYEVATASGAWTATLSGTNNIRGGWAYLTAATAPACALMESWERPATKGFAVQNLHGYAGATSTTIASDIAGIDGSGSAMLESYLTALVDRQAACGGSGRVLVHMNFGINGGGDSFATWKASCESIIAQFSLSWIASGHEPSNLAFLLEVTHDLYQYSTGSTRQNLALARSAADDWAAAGHAGAAVCDLSIVAPGSVMAANYWYSASGSGNEIHLCDAGYLGVRLAAAQRLVA